MTLAVVENDAVFIVQQPCAANEYHQAIMQLVDKSELDLVDANAQIVLGHGLYQIAQLEKPNVPENEWPQALLWSAKDLVSIANENMLLDYFEYYSDNQNNKRLNVVACDKLLIKPVTDYLLSLDINIKGISIVDIVLAQLINEPTPRVIVFHVPGMNVEVAIVKNGQLCFSRVIKGYDNLHQLSSVDFQAGHLNNLGLEIQRCIDFAVGQLKLEAVTNVSLVVQNLEAAQIASSLQELFDIDVAILPAPFSAEFERYPLSALALAEMELAG